MVSAMEVGWWALIVSSVSALFTGLTYWRNRTPRPRWVIEWDCGHDDPLTDSVRCVARNRGPGVALDVTLEAVDSAGKREYFPTTSRAEVAFGEELELWFSFKKGDPSFPDGAAVLLDSNGSSTRMVPSVLWLHSRTAQVRLRYHRRPRTTKTLVMWSRHTDVEPGRR